MTFNHNFTRHFCILLILFFFCFIFILILNYSPFCLLFLIQLRTSYFAFEIFFSFFKFPFDYYNCGWNNHHWFNWWIWIANGFEFHSWLRNSDAANQNKTTILMRSRHNNKNGKFIWWLFDLEVHQKQKTISEIR